MSASSQEVYALLLKNESFFREARKLALKIQYKGKKTQEAIFRKYELDQSEKKKKSKLMLIVALAKLFKTEPRPILEDKFNLAFHVPQKNSLYLKVKKEKEARLMLLAETLTQPQNEAFTKALFEEFQTVKNNKRRARRIDSFIVAPLNNITNFCGSIAYNYPLPPINWILNAISTGAYFLSNMMSRIVVKFNPDRAGPPIINTSSTTLGFISSITAGIGMVVGAVAAPWFFAVAALSLALQNLVLLGGSLKEWVDTIRTKEPKASYGLRVFNSTIQCANNALGAAFGLSMSILAVAAVVALFANPVGLTALAGAAFIFGLSMAAASLGASIVGKVNERAIKRIETGEKSKLKMENDLSLKQKISERADRKIDKKLIDDYSVPAPFLPSQKLTHKKEIKIQEDQEDKEKSSKPHPPHG